MLGGLDLAVFLVCLAAVMGIGLLAGGRGQSSEEYFLASRSMRWWGVAGSVFGTNVSANHLVGMLGVGFSFGFAQSHFELGAVFALLALAYLLLPVFAGLRVHTLSEYLALRYDERASLLYSVTTLLLIAAQMTALFYVGSRSMSLLLRDTILDPGYVGGVAALATITGIYTIVGGMRAVVWTDVIQSGLLLVSGILVALATFAQPEIGGFSGLLANDAAVPRPDQRMHLYLPADHASLPWTGVFTGLMVMHLSFWCTNQYIVQRTLAARSQQQARYGILAGGFLKLFVPFFSIAGGVAAAQLVAARMGDVQVAPDEAFPVLMSLVLPAGGGLLGLVAAGLLGAILSTIDSMLNSAAALFSFDIYRKHWHREAEDADLVRLGRIVVVVLVSLAGFLAATTYDPNSQGNFFLQLSRQLSYLTPGLLVAFLMGMFSPRATARGAAAAILASPVVGVALEWAYAAQVAGAAAVPTFGYELNFMHRTFLTALSCLLVHALVSRTTARDPAKDAYLFTTVTGTTTAHLQRLARWCVGYVLGNMVLGGLLVAGWLGAGVAGFLAAVFTLVLFAGYLRQSAPAADEGPVWLRDDRWLAGLLTAAVTFVLYYFY